MYVGHARPCFPTTHLFNELLTLGGEGAEELVQALAQLLLAALLVELLRVVPVCVRACVWFGIAVLRLCCVAVGACVRYSFV